MRTLSSDGFLYEIFKDVIGVMSVAEDVLSAEEHLEFGVLNAVADGAETVPGVFVEETEAGIEGSTAPSFERMVADFIELGKNLEHFVGGHSGSDKRLVRVAKDCFGDFQFISHNNNPF